MNPKFQKMLDKKRDLKPMEKHAKMDVLKDMHHSAAESFGDKLGGLNKASPMSQDPDIHDIPTSKPMSPTFGPKDDTGPSAYADGGEVSEESPEHEMSESPSEEASEESSEHSPMDLEAVKQQIAHLLMVQQQLEEKLK